MAFRPSRRSSRSSPIEDDPKANPGIFKPSEDIKTAAMEIFNHGKDKRRSLDMRRSASPSVRKGPKDSPKLVPVKAATLEIEMESPPLVFYGPPGYVFSQLPSAL